MTMIEGVWTRTVMLVTVWDGAKRLTQTAHFIGTDMDSLNSSSDFLNVLRSLFQCAVVNVAVVHFNTG